MAYMVVLFCFLIHMTVIGSDNEFFHTLQRNGAIALLFGQAVGYLFYPLLGWLADVYFTRYKFILVSFIIMIVAAVISITMASLSVIYVDSTVANEASLYVGGLCLIVGVIAVGLFESTAIQFGIDQMLEASSDQLNTLIHWYYWSSNIGPVIVAVMSAGVLQYYSQCTIKLTDIQHPDELYETLHPYYFTVTGTVLLFMATLQLVCACVGLCLLVKYKKHFNIDRTGEHPLKLIYQVLKYSWKHTCPENRSAFTYWEEDIPPRIDLGKSKYGGPFTTEEVEDTKTFFSILLILLSLFGFHLSAHSDSISEQLTRKQCSTHWVLMFLQVSFPVVFLTVIIVVPLYQLARNCFSKCLPNMLKRMGIGLFFCFVKEVSEIAIQSTMMGGEYCHHFDNNTINSCFFLTSELNMNGTCLTISNLTDNYFHCDQDNTSFLLLLIPEVLEGLFVFLVFMTALEFICAQAPLRLKGLLVGVWYALLAIKYLLVKVPELFTVSSTSWVIFHTVKAFLIFLSLIMFLCVSKRYHYRQQDEVVNERFLVEEIYEREFDMAEQYEKENNGNPTLITSTGTCRLYGATD